MLKRLGEIFNRTLPIFAFIGLLACSGIGSLAPGNNLAAPEKGPDAVGDAGGGGAGAGGGSGGGGGGGSGDLGAGSTGEGTPLTVYAATGHSGITQLGGGAATTGGPYQPTSEGHAQTGSYLYARAIPAAADHDPECSGMVGDAHTDFTEPFPQVTVWYGNSAGGPWVHPETWASDACGYRPIYCEYYDRDENDLPITVKPDFMKVQAVYDTPMVMTFPPKPPQHFESCPRVIDCHQFVRTATEVPLKLFEGVASCEGPSSLPAMLAPQNPTP